MLHTETIEESTLELLKKLQQETILENTVLVGGTALALKIGHRTSIDIDLFTTEKIDTGLLQQVLESNYDFMPMQVFGNSVIGEINGVKVDVIYHPYPWIRNIQHEEGIRQASLQDITAMKLHAIINSGKRPKDFVDIAFLSKYFSYDIMKELLLAKYPKYDSIMADRAINYFDDVNTDLIPEIKLIDNNLDFNKIKKRLVEMTDKPEIIFDTSPLEQPKNKSKIRR